MQKKIVNSIYITLQILIAILGIYFLMAYALERTDWWLCDRPLSRFNDCFYSLLYSFLPILVSKLKISYAPGLKLYFFLAIIGHFMLGGCFDFYRNLKYYSFFTHFLNSFVMGVIIYGIILRACKKQGNLFLFLTTLGCICLIGVVWEFYEFFNDILLGKNMQRTLNSITGEPFLGKEAIRDTMLDFIMDFSGGALAGLLSNKLKIKHQPLYKLLEVKSLKLRPIQFGSTTYIEDTSLIKERINQGQKESQTTTITPPNQDNLAINPMEEEDLVTNSISEQPNDAISTSQSIDSNDKF